VFLRSPGHARSRFDHSGSTASRPRHNRGRCHSAARRYRLRFGRQIAPMRCRTLRCDRQGNRRSAASAAALHVLTGSSRFGHHSLISSTREFIHALQRKGITVRGRFSHLPRPNPVPDRRLRIDTNRAEWQMADQGADPLRQCAASASHCGFSRIEPRCSSRYRGSTSRNTSGDRSQTQTRLECGSAGSMSFPYCAQAESPGCRALLRGPINARVALLTDQKPGASIRGFFPAGPLAQI